MMVQVQAPQLPTQLAANPSGEGENVAQVFDSPAIHMRKLDGIPGSVLQPGPVKLLLSFVGNI